MDLITFATLQNAVIVFSAVKYAYRFTIYMVSSSDSTSQLAFSKGGASFVCAEDLIDTVISLDGFLPEGNPPPLLSNS